ncbi:MAG TPA: hypothetical protein VII78_11910 [Myxococcota bacterium]|jgi:hypothetical protein
MKTLRLVTLAILATLLAASAGLAQATSDFELSRDVLRAQRKLLVSQNLTLSEAEAAAFWPTYDQYAAEQRALNDRLVKAIEGFAADYDTLTDDRAEELLEESLSIREDRNQLRRSYLKRFSKAITGKKLARFYQIDSKIDALLDAKIAQAIPLAR